MTIEKIKQIAREEYGMKMTNDMAEKYIAKFYDKLGKLSDDEMDNVSGGYGSCDKECWYGKYCEPCEVWCDSFEGSYSYKCPKCGAIYK